MRQRLQFESAWDKTIATRDREKIKKAFHGQLPQLNDGIHFSYLWKAKNHRNDLLITVLIHNRTKSILHLKNTSISYTEHEQMTVTGHLDRKSIRLNSSHVAISYAVFCLKKKNKK